MVAQIDVSGVDMGSAATSGTGTQPARSIDELDRAIVSLASEINVASFRMLVLVREFDDRFGWAKWSFMSCAEWLAWRLGISLSAAREKVRTAHALRDLPEIALAFSEGRLSYTKVRALTRAANGANEDLLVAYALNATASQVEERCRQIRNVLPDSAELAHKAWQRRALTISRNPANGTLVISAEVPIEDGEVIAKALDRAVETAELARGPEMDTESWQVQQADALLAMARSYLGGEPGEGSETGAKRAADHYQVVVHVDEIALRGGISHQNGAEPLGGGRVAPSRSDLPIETIRRISCDGSVVRLATDDSGNSFDIGRKQRTVPTAIKRALEARDRGCTFPGCHRTHYVDAHHIEHWALGGETTLENLTLLCTQHHRLLHEGGYRIEREPDGALRFHRADARVIPRCGYRLDDMRDGIREPRGVYLAA